MSRLTANEVISSMTGFEERIIEKVVGKGIDHMAADGDSLLMIRSTAAMLKAREAAAGAPTSEREFRAAYQEIQAMPRDDLSEIFETEEDEPFPDEPVTDQGKDDSELGQTPPSSPPSVSEQD
jgi:hypothetical protein